MKAGGRMANEYVEQRHGGYYLTGVRVSLDSIVYAFLRGESPESIAESFPALNLEQVYGGVAFFFVNGGQIEQNSPAPKGDFYQMREETRRGAPFPLFKTEAAPAT